MSAEQQVKEKSEPDLLLEFPFRLNSVLPEFKVANDLLVCQMSNDKKRSLLRIENTEYNEDGLLAKFNPLNECLLNEQLRQDINDIFQFCSSNYMLIAPSRERAMEFNFALKLIGNSVSSLYIGFAATSRSFLSPSYFGSKALAVEAHEAKEFVSILRLVECAREDKKLQTMHEIYMHALNRNIRKESRFIEMVIILEMLLLPTSSSELSYRFSLRLAKLMGRIKNEPISHVFKMAQRIYKTRSCLVHKGTDNDLDAIAPVAYDYVRVLLAAYLRDPQQFQNERLDELCLS